MKKILFNRRLLFLPIALLLYISIEFAPLLKAQDLDPVITALQSISSMVFTIMGIWIAYIYPNAMLKITQPKKMEAIFSEDDESRIQTIVGTVILSAFVLTFLLLGVAIRPILVKSQIYLSYIHFFKTIGVFLLLTLVYIQLIAIYIVMASNLNFIIDLRNKKTKRDLDDKF